MINQIHQVSSSYNESEFDEQQHTIQVAFFSQKSLEDKRQFSNLNINQPHDMKAPSETIQEYIFTDEKLEVSGRGLTNIQLLKNQFLNIKLLDLSRSKLFQIPDEIRQMVNLQKLFLGSNLLTFVPSFLENLNYLTILDVSHNQILQYSIRIPNLKQLNVAGNFIDQIIVQNLDILCIQQNPIVSLPQSFGNVIKKLMQLELDWFKYCKPPLPLKMNFSKQLTIHQKLQKALEEGDLSFLRFVKLLSVNEQNFSGTDYKERNLYCQAGINDDIGVLYGLKQIIPQEINRVDFDNNTPMAVCYMEGKMRSVSILKSFGGRFSTSAIHSICQRADILNLKFILGINDIVMQHSINDESLVMIKNPDGNTPLHHLFMNFDKYDTSKDVALIILQFGADPNIENYEGCTPLDMGIRKQQLQAVKFAYSYNHSNQSDFNQGRYFNFHHQSSQTGYGLTHSAVSAGNVEIMEFLLSINADFFQVTKQNRIPRNLATASLCALKNARKLEKRWIHYNVICEKSMLEQQAKNVYQMRNQIEKNIVQRHHNMVQKFIDQEEIDVSIESYNDFSLQVGSECSVRETVAESAPVFQLKCREPIQVIKQHMDQMNQLDFLDQLPDVQKLLRSNNIDMAIRKLQNVLLSDLQSASEKLKYKNQLILLKYKFRQKRLELRALVGGDVRLLLNEFQFKNLKSEQRNRYYKEIQSILLEVNKAEIQKSLSIVARQRTICSAYNLNKDLKIQDISQVTEMRTRLSSNLIYDINNYAQHLFASQSQLHTILVANSSKTEKLLDFTCFFNMANFEYLQQMRFKKKRVVVSRDESIEKDMIEPESVLLHQMSVKGFDLYNMLNQQLCSHLQREFVDSQIVCRDKMQLKCDDLHVWVILLHGPKLTPYEGGLFLIQVEFIDYPQYPPKIRFLNRIYHPNINQSGNVALTTIKQWTPYTKIKEVLCELYNIILEPNLKNPLVQSIALQYQNQFGEYFNKAKLWTYQYAISI